MDNALDQHPGLTIVIGGDVNQLDVQELCMLTGWNALVTFPTRGDSYLDNVFTNRPDLFGECIPYNISIKTDHTAVILPAGKKLKPLRKTIKIRDCRKHRKEALYLALAEEKWDSVLESNDVNEAVRNLENLIHDNLEKCMPLKTVRMSSRDPLWMTPLVKSLLKTKSKIGPNNTDRLKEINKKISDLICKNRKNILQAPVGSRDWWRHIDNLSQRRRSSAKVSLDEQSLVELNDYFANLCWDTAYEQPTLVEVHSEDHAPVISERYVWQCLQHLKNTATGPDLIPSWIWKEHAEIFTSIICKIWNWSLESSVWPSSWKRAHVTPLPKVDVPKGKTEYRGINITPVIARAFEKAVYNIHVRETVEELLSSTQFAYRTGGSCTDALLCMQHSVYGYLDSPECKAVRLFAMDFSKAFDSVKHTRISQTYRTS
ncbi:uncharacterized protein LOC116601437 [Nematostella vectensis]|uniref:uncharacterized protein LOC116601437 n=1 Tax=Nematostella vectensis TaxID=45351 RepID=UPI0020771EBE|nr:uncharacterized protein LOC116601437 [Nematostella vectensis]